MKRPTLAAVSLAPTGGGVAVVARLLWQLFDRQWGSQAQLLPLIRNGGERPTFAQKVRYALTLAARLRFEATDWILFSHLGLAKPLGRIPARWHKPYAVFLHGIEAWR